VAPDPALTHVLTFHETIANGTRAAGDAVVLRVPNRPDLYPAGLRVRTAEGALLAPDAKALSDADVEVDGQGNRTVRVSVAGGAGERLRAWACSVTVDGVPSVLAGPWPVHMPPAPLAVPVLAGARVGSQVFFAWTWPPGDHAGLEVGLERSQDGVAWHRISPLLDAATTSHVHTPGSDDPLRYRLLVQSPAGRRAFGDAITVP
jgi:hypothetical protein